MLVLYEDKGNEQYPLKEVVDKRTKQFNPIDRSNDGPLLVVFDLHLDFMFSIEMKDIFSQLSLLLISKMVCEKDLSNRITSKAVFPSILDLLHDRYRQT